MNGTYTSRRLVMFGISTSLLIHLLAFWLLNGIEPPIVKPESTAAEQRVIVSLAPAAAPATPATPSVKSPAPQQAEQPKLKAKPARVAPAKKQTPPPLAIQRQPPRPASIAAAEPAPQPPPQSDDMFTQLEAARKRRADAQAQAEPPKNLSEPSPSAEAAPDNSVALANIAFSLKQAKGKDKVDSGGLFQVRRVGFRDAEFLFKGWNATSSRNSTRLISVDQGTEADIQTALVKKMIDIIREERKEDFIWESKRLGKQLTLSARQQDSVELQDFLLREFFPDYVRSASRG